MATRRALLRALLNGLRTELLGHKRLTLGGKTYTRRQLERLFGEAVDAAAATDAALAVYRAAVAKERATTASAERLRAQFELMLFGLLGADNPHLQRFGFTVRKPPRRPSPETRLAAAAKRRATRLARGTMGKKQKIGVRGA